jgi:tetratricopeptide (TPR) repeat protein
MNIDSRPARTDRHWAARLAAAAAVAAFCVGCAQQPPAPAPAPAAPPKAPEPVAPAPAPAPAPLVPELPPAQAKAEAQKLAIASIDMLQNGDEANAKATLEKALAYDPSNDLAKKLMDQIKADAQAELGSTFFRYTVQRDDSLSKIAQTYLGDRFRFYILAKYNDIANPSKLGAGQVIKVPGKGPIAPPPTARPAAPVPAPVAAEPAPAPAVAAPAEPEAPKKSMSALMQQGMTQQKAGNLDAAYESFSDAVKAEPGNKDAVVQRDSVKVALVRRYDREAAQAYQRQNLDLAIKKWDQILELDPNNQKAKLEKERAVELKKKMAEKFGTAGTAGTAK